MIMDPNTLVIQYLRDGISTIENSRHTMEKFCALIPKFDSIDCISLPPIEILVVQKSLELILDQSSQIGLWVV